METNNRALMIRIYEDISLIEEVLQGIGFEDYRTDRKIRIVVLRIIERMIGLSNEIDPEFKDKFPEIDWSAIQFFKSKFLDKDGIINDDEIWKMCKHTYMKLKKSIDSVLQNMD